VELCVGDPHIFLHILEMKLGDSTVHLFKAQGRDDSCSGCDCDGE